MDDVAVDKLSLRVRSQLLAAEERAIRTIQVLHKPAAVLEEHLGVMTRQNAELHRDLVVRFASDRHRLRVGKLPFAVNVNVVKSQDGLHRMSPYPIISRSTS